MTLDIDDRNREIPTPVEGVVRRVAVIGAGIAGLTAANALSNAGVEVIVLEARERIGGRLNTVELAGTPVDLGGSWIHHPIGNPITEWADHLGAARRDGDPRPDRGWDRATRSWVPEEEYRRLDDEWAQRWAETIASRAAAGLPDQDAGRAIFEFVAGLDLPEPTAGRLAQTLRLGAEADAADFAERTSARWLTQFQHYGGPNLGPQPVGGYLELLAPLAVGLDIAFGFDVDSVESGSGGVLVKARDGRIVAATHVVCTAPFGVLKAGRIAFVPPLPQRIDQVLVRQSFSSMEKVALAFESAPWRASGIRQARVFPADRAEAAIGFFDFDDTAGHPAAVFMLFASSHRHTLDVSDREAVAWAIGMLEELSAGPVPTPLAAVVTRWRDDPYALGSYAHAVPGSDAASDFGQFAVPHGRVVFAGEHTYAPRLGYADAAMASGIREAKRLLRQRSVGLGRLG